MIRLKCIISKPNADNAQPGNQTVNEPNNHDIVLNATHVNQTRSSIQNQNLHSSVSNESSLKNEIRELKNTVSIIRVLIDYMVHRRSAQLKTYLFT